MAGDPVAADGDHSEAKCYLAASSPSSIDLIPLEKASHRRRQRDEEEAPGSSTCWEQNKVTAELLRQPFERDVGDKMNLLHQLLLRLPEDWSESPLILGAQMGIPEFVTTILRVCPEAATYLDTRARSVLQVAIEHGNREIVRTIREMTRGKNPILPSWLLSRVDKGTGRTILHFASPSPGEKDPATGNSLYFGRAAFKVFSHAYVIGLSCAATSLVLFLSLAMSPYKEQQFRRIIPTKYFFARSSFGLAILSFLVQLYGWQKTKSKHLIPFVLELTVFPVICFLVLFLRGFEFDLSFLSRSWR
ncbi:hypothetical protein GW17_00057969 [Ensete ventricosum]|nr:hypothetical protein GW17_00057969 [Ensete ventricosum]